VPVGLGIGKLVMIGPLPVKFTLEADYMVIHPDDFGEHWGVRFQIIPVIPALFKDTLFYLSLSNPLRSYSLTILG
jgi:hypothetical protein